jgi:hypothetical protein
MFDITQLRYYVQFYSGFGDESIAVMDAVFRNSSSSHTVKYLQSVKTLHVKIINIFGATADNTSAAQWRSQNFQFRIADDIFDGNLS